MKTLSPRSMFVNTYEVLVGRLNTAVSETVSDFVNDQGSIYVAAEILEDSLEAMYWASLCDAQEDSCHHNLDQFIKNVHTTWGTR